MRNKKNVKMKIYMIVLKKGLLNKQRLILVKKSLDFMKKNLIFFIYNKNKQ